MVMKSFRERREKLGLSQPQVARLKGCRQSAISNIECGKGKGKGDSWDCHYELLEVLKERHPDTWVNWALPKSKGEL